MASVGGSTSVSPPNLTFSEAKLEISRYVKMPRSAEGQAVAGEKWRNALRLLNSRPWSWLEKTATVTWVADQVQYDLPVDFKKPRLLQVLDSSGNREYTVEYLTPKRFLEHHENVSGNSSRPNDYTVVRDASGVAKLEVDVAPSASFITTKPTASLYYYARVVYPIGENDKVVLPPEVELLALWYAKKEMASDYYPRKVREATNEYQRLWAQLIDDDEDDRDGYEGVQIPGPSFGGYS